MHARNNFDQAQTKVPAPPDTAEGFAVMSYAQRVDLHARIAELYRQLATQEAATASGTVAR